jgi:glutamate-1-semialdehyde 2,1-aminomutase
MSGDTVSNADATWDDARRLLAYGNQHRVLLRPLYRGEESVFPRFAVRGQGCEIEDEQGRTFIDWANAWGPVLLGYRHPAVEQAIRTQLEAGPTLSLMHPVEVEVARSLTEMVPCAEMVAFGKNGSDVTTAAVRVARAATGREVIVQCGFHGFHDWYTCLHENAVGSPHVLRPLIQPFPYGDPGALAELLDRFAGQVAAVVMEPVNAQMPQPGYLEAVRELAHSHGALLVFDELVTAFRVANGGAQELFGVTPDLACLGKAMGNGMPLSAIVGRAELMRHLPHVAWGMTFRGETLSLAAARATLDVLRAEPVVARLAAIGAHVRREFDRMCDGRGIAGRLTGPDARLTVVFDDQAGVRADRLTTLFIQECAVHGVLTTGTLLPSYAHHDDAVECTLAAFGQALDTVAALVAGSTNGRVPRRVLATRGFIDGMVESEDALELAGWLLVDDRPPDQIVIAGLGDALVEAERVTRAGVAAVYPDVEGAERSGWAARLPRADYLRDGTWDFELRALRDGEVVFSCTVGRRARPDGALPGLPGPYEVAGGSLYI